MVYTGTVFICFLTGQPNIALLLLFNLLIKHFSLSALLFLYILEQWDYTKCELIGRGSCPRLSNTFSNLFIVAVHYTNQHTLCIDAIVD